MGCEAIVGAGSWSSRLTGHGRWHCRLVHIGVVGALVTPQRASLIRRRRAGHGTLVVDANARRNAAVGFGIDETRTLARSVVLAAEVWLVVVVAGAFASTCAAGGRCVFGVI